MSTMYQLDGICELCSVGDPRYTAEKAVIFHVRTWSVCLRCIRNKFTGGDDSSLVKNAQEFLTWLSSQNMKPSDLVHPNPYIREEAQKILGRDE